MNVKHKPYDVNLKHLSPPSKQFILFRNANGFRPLLLQSSQFNCYPFKTFNAKKHIALEKQRQEIENLVKDLNYNYIVERIKYNQEQLVTLQRELAETPKTVETIEKQYVLDGEIKAVKKFLSDVELIEKKGKENGRYAYHELNIHGFDESDAEYLKALDKLRHLEQNFYTETAGGKCDACGITLPNAIEKHTDFLSYNEVSLCPYCHSCEHLDDSYISGTISYVPYFSQEQINLFYHAYHILKYALEGDKESVQTSKAASAIYSRQAAQKEQEIQDLEIKTQKSIDDLSSQMISPDERSAAVQRFTDEKNAKIKIIKKEIDAIWREHDNDPRLKAMRQRSAMLSRQIHIDAINFTYGELFKYMTNLDRYFHSGENVLIRYFENVANFEPAALKREYENRINADIENLEEFIQQKNGVFNADESAYPVKKMFTYNIDSPNSPHFLASFFMRNGLHLQSDLSKEARLNLLTRISGVRYLPDFEKYKVHIKGWVGHYLNNEMDKVLNNFISLNMRLFDEDFIEAVNSTIEPEKPQSAPQATPATNTIGAANATAATTANATATTNDENTDSTKQESDENATISEYDKLKNDVEMVASEVVNPEEMKEILDSDGSDQQEEVVVDDEEFIADPHLEKSKLGGDDDY